MKMLIAGAAALVLAASSSALVAAPAMAGDLLYEATPDSLTERLDGQPYWAAQAQCAGLFGAATQYFEANGDTAAADEARGLALGFANDAITRLTRDRGMTRAQALDFISPAVLQSRDASADVVAANTGPSSTWNFARSSCLDIADAYATQASW